MFSDERIEQLSGRIFRKGIAAATLLTALFLVCKLLSFGKFRLINLSSCLAELTVIITGVVLLIVGELGRERPEVKDERYYTEKFSFYNKKASRIFLVAALAGFACSVPIYLVRPNDLPSNMLLIFLELLGLVFIARQFKHNGINLNYSIIDENNHGYYIAVLKRMGKLALVIAAMYGISAWQILWLVQGRKGVMLLSVLFACLSSMVSLCSFYFIISWIEKVARNEEETDGKIYKSLLISFCFVMALDLLSLLLQMAYSALGTGFWNRTSIPGQLTLGEITALFNYTNKYLGYYINAFLGLSLANSLIYVTGKVKKLVSAMIGFIYAGIILGFFILAILPTVTESIETIRVYSTVTSSLAASLAFASAIFQTVLLGCLAKRYDYSKWLPVLAAALVALQIVCFFLRADRILFGTLYNAAGLAQTVLLAHTMITLKKHQT